MQIILRRSDIVVLYSKIRRSMSNLHRNILRHLNNYNQNVQFRLSFQRSIYAYLRERKRAVLVKWLSSFYVEFYPASTSITVLIRLDFDKNAVKIKVLIVIETSTVWILSVIPLCIMDYITDKRLRSSTLAKLDVLCIALFELKRKEENGYFENWNH